MCVIVYKPKGIDFPSVKTLEECFKRNSDGAGYMLPLNNSVVIRKGFMSLNDLFNDIYNFGTSNNIDFKETPYVLHFRIQTQGGIKKELCHPYPLTRAYTHMRELYTESKFGVAHNGIISLTTSPLATHYNDTMTFIKEYLFDIIKNDLHWYKDPFKAKLIQGLIGHFNKLAIMGADGFTKLIGKFYKNTDGCYYSNLNHQVNLTTYRRIYQTNTSNLF